MTGIVKDPRYFNHEMGAYHVESPARLKTIYRALEEDRQLTSKLKIISPRLAQMEEILWIHEKNYYHLLESTQARERVILDPDTSTNPSSFQTARLAVGGVLEAARAIMEEEITNAFALIRPPGHHAEKARAMGFCLFNNVAIAAEYLRRSYSVDRIVIFDWDVHHGNGTQNAFYNRDDVLYFSLHQYPHYPGTGHWSEIGQGPGQGLTINCPLQGGKGDADYLYALERLLSPIIDTYQPQFFLVSAGFDPHQADPLSSMLLTAPGFAALTEWAMTKALATAQGRLLLVLEGGYALEALAESVKQVLYQLARFQSRPQLDPNLNPQTEEEISQVVKSLKPFWPLSS